MTDFYHTKRWHRLRLAILQRDGWKCQFAAQNGRSEPAVTVHHIFPLSEYPEYKWEPWNLISLSYTAHDMMHDRNTSKLTRRGELLKRQTAEEQGIDLHQTTTLVIGNPHSGKTTYVKQHMKRGVCYDLDYIAGALRLKNPKEDDYKPARWLANALYKGFSDVAHVYCNDVWIIRTAPTIDEVQDINPTKIVILYGNYGDEELKEDRRVKVAQKIKAVASWAKLNGVQVEEHETT